jgi:predicted transcriptional regulator of viral defense system
VSQVFHAPRLRAGPHRGLLDPAESRSILKTSRRGTSRPPVRSFAYRPRHVFVVPALSRGGAGTTYPCRRPHCSSTGAAFGPVRTEWMLVGRLQRDMRKGAGVTFAFEDIAARRADGLLLTADLGEVGVSRDAIRSAAARGEVVRVRRGVYLPRDRWDGLNDDGRYRLLVRASVAASRRPCVVSHLSAAAMHGLPLIGSWPTSLQVWDGGAAGGSSSRMVDSHRGGPEPEVVVIDGIHVTSLRRTLVDVATTSSFLVGVTMIDHALREEARRGSRERRRSDAHPLRTTAEDLLEELDRVAPRYGRATAERAIRFASPLAGSAGESLSRVRMYELGFLVPELQVRFDDVLGSTAVVDFFWRGVRAIGEFDGRVKYSRGQPWGDRDPAAVVYDEKLREDALRRRVDAFMRWPWSIAISPRVFGRFLSDHDVPRR